MSSPESWADWLGVVGSVASLASFGAAGYAAVKVRAIARTIVFNVRAGEISGEIAKFSKWISDNINDYPDNHREMGSQLSQWLALLCRVRMAVPAEARGCIQRIACLEKSYRNKEPDISSVERKKDILWGIYTEIENFLMHIRHSNADRRLGGPDENR